jgi:hypothetical protein
VRHRQSASGTPLCNLLLAHHFLYLLALPVMMFPYGIFKYPAKPQPELPDRRSFLVPPVNGE